MSNLKRLLPFITILISCAIIYQLDASYDLKSPQVLGATTPYHPTDGGSYGASNSTIFTITSFEEKEITEEEEITYETRYINDENMEIGQTKIEQEGVDGKISRTYLATYWYGEESKRVLLDTKVENPQDEVIAVGTKVIWRSTSTHGEKNVEDSELDYWRKVENVWATSYDKSCFGCSETTALGARIDYGVCAVDPKVIKLWTQIYVPGYGVCTALDVGGAIKGNKIDVGFYDLHAQSAEVGWRGAHYTDIYLLNNEEANLELMMR